MVFILGLVNPAYSGNFCVESSVSLASVLQFVGLNNEHDHVMITEGTYPVPNDPSGRFQTTIIDGMDVTISGGWSEFFGNPCGQQTPGGWTTEIDGHNDERGLIIEVGGPSTVTVSNLSFWNGWGIGLGHSGGAILALTTNTHTGQLILENNLFINNRANLASALHVDDVNHLVVRNNYFTMNRSNQGGPTVLIKQNMSYGTHFTNNTLIENTSINVTNDTVNGAVFEIQSPAQLFVANNMFWDHPEADVKLDGDGTTWFLYNNYLNLVGTFDHGNGNLSVPPGFEPDVFAFRPSRNSPLVNAGLNPPPFIPVPTPFNLDWNPGSSDFNGNPRIQNDRIDIGAHESPHWPVIFYSGFESDTPPI